jgi:hypothetical protein
MNGQPDTRPDAELLRAYRDPDNDDDGRALNTIYFRHRDEVVRALADEGLSVDVSDERVGEVFLRALNGETVDSPLAELLRDAAHAVAHDLVEKPI